MTAGALTVLDITLGFSVNTGGTVGSGDFLGMVLCKPGGVVRSIFCCSSYPSNVVYLGVSGHRCALSLGGMSSSPCSRTLSGVLNLNSC